MKKQLVAWILAVLAVFVPVASADQTTTFISRGLGRYNASAYSWRGQVVVGNAGTGTQTVTIGFNTSLADGRQFLPFGAGYNVLSPVVFDVGAVSETVTPTAVSATTCPLTGQFGPQIQCASFTGSFSFTHGLNAVAASGTFGLQEAIADAIANNNPVTGTGGGTVVIDSTWPGLGTLFTTMATVTPYPMVTIEDETGIAGYHFWKASASTTSTAASAAAPTLTTGTGTLTSGQYFVKVAYVDLQGQISQVSTESSQTATTTSITVTAPAAAAGQVGYIVYLTSAGGSTNTETDYPLTPSNCTLTKAELIIPACTVTNTSYGQSGSNALLTTNPATTTFKTMGATDTINRTAFAYQVANNVAAAIPVPNVILSQAATGTAAATYQIASANFPGGLFTQTTREFRVCGTGHDTFGGVAGQTLALSLFYGPYNNSDTSLISLTTAAGTATAGTQVLHFCFDLDVVAITGGGTTASVLPHGWADVNLANSNVVSRIQDQVSAAVTSLPITGSNQMRFQLVVGAQALAAGFVLDKLTFEPVD